MFVCVCLVVLFLSNWKQRLSEMGGTKDGADFLGEPKKTCLERERERGSSNNLVVGALTKLETILNYLYQENGTIFYKEKK